MAPKLRRQKISEQITVDDPVSRGAIRSIWSGFRRTFWPQRTSYSTSKVDYAVTRSLYRNDDSKTNLAGFSKPIVDLASQFTGLPRAASGDEIYDDFLNDAIQNHWANKLGEMKRDAIRDSKTIVRIRKASEKNILVTAEESEACFLEIVPPEAVEIFYTQGVDIPTIERAYIQRRLEVVIDWEETPTGPPQPRTEEHIIVEVITADQFRYYDETAHAWMDELQQSNPWGFVPLVEVWNEYDAALEGGQSDLEAVLPFLRAFHEVLHQALSAHKYHSIPKAKFKINDIQNFLMNNFPDSFDRDENNQPIVGTFDGRITWKGTEILFFEPDEDGGFMEAKSVLGDSKVLLDFLLDCICVTSETPRWAFNLEVVERNLELSIMPLKKKIERKREIFTDPIQMICKMVLKINGMEPRKIQMAWSELSTSELVNQMQALQQLVMGIELAVERGLISDQTARQTFRPFIPAMKASDQEAADAKKNLQLLATQAAPNDPANPQSQNGNKNGNLVGQGVGGKNA